MSTQERRPTPEDIPPQQLEYPASQRDMTPQPDSDLSNYSPANKLTGKVAFITGGDSGIGRAVAIAYAMEGAEVAILYHANKVDAEDTKKMVKEIGNKDCLVIQGDVRNYEDCESAISKVVERFGKLNILINNAAYQMVQKKFEDITLEQFRRTFRNQCLWLFSYG